MKTYFKENYKQIIVKVLIVFAVLVIDLVTKSFFANVFSQRYENNNFENIVFIKYFISFTYTENVGAAFSIFSGHVAFLIIFSLVFIGIFVAIDLIYKDTNWLFATGMSLVLGGAIGNLVDRIFLGYVRDFISFDFIKNFAICNFADCCITIGCVCIGIYLLIGLVKDGKRSGRKQVKKSNNENVDDVKHGVKNQVDSKDKENDI